MKKRAYTAEESRRLLDQVRSLRHEGLTVSEACQRLDLAEQTYYRWANQAAKAEKLAEDTMPSAASSELEELRALVLKLTIENHRLKQMLK